VVEGSGKIRDYRTYTTLRKFGIECTITAEWTFNFGDKSRYFNDSKGNEFIRSTLRVTVSYQNQISDDLDLVTNRVKFILACCEAANQLKVAHQGKKVYQVWKTVEDKAERLLERNKKVLTESILPHLKGMRFKASRTFCVGDTSNLLVQGDYDIEIKAKKYQVTVSDSKVVTVTRTA
jgi:hypothetical protein